MKAIQILPENYREIFSVNLQKNKKIAVLINVLAVLIAIAMAIPMHFYIPITTLFSFENGIKAYFIRILAFFLLIIVYMLLHELVHGITMKFFGTKKVKYGFTGLYAFAGSEDYYNKRSYIIIALAPVVFLGIIIAVVNALVPADWFWVIYLLQISNISGAAGDLYVTVKFASFPRDILVKDSGIGMTVYSKQ